MRNVTKKTMAIALSSMFVLGGSYPVANSTLKVLNPFSGYFISNAEKKTASVTSDARIKASTFNGGNKIKIELGSDYAKDALYYVVELPSSVRNYVGKTINNKKVRVVFRNNSGVNYELNSENFIDSNKVVIPAKNGDAQALALAIEIQNDKTDSVDSDIVFKDLGDKEYITIKKVNNSETREATDIADKAESSITAASLNNINQDESDYSSSFGKDDEFTHYAFIKPNQELVIRADASHGANLMLGLPYYVGNNTGNDMIVEYFGNMDVLNVVKEGKNPLDNRSNKYNSDMYSKTELSSLSTSTISASHFVGDSSFFRITLKDGATPVALRYKLVSTISAPNTSHTSKPSEPVRQEPVKINANVYRYSEKNRYETSLLLSKKGFSSADTAVIASGKNYADALAGGPLAVAVNGPLLLTDGSSTSINNIKNELSRLGVKKLYFLGGLRSIDLDDQKEIEKFRDNVDSTRIEGADRYETSYKVFKEATKYEGIGESPVVVSGKNFADALSAGPVAAINNRAILLTNGYTLPQKSYMEDTNNIIIGGTASVSNAIKGTRISGSDRYDTAANVAKYYFKDSKNAVLASGVDYPDGLSSISLYNEYKAPLLLTKKNTLPTPTRNMINSSKIKNIYVVGGENSVNSSVFDALKGL